MLVVVNDNFSSDRLGTVIHPLQNVKVALKAASWSEPREVFEISSEGTRDISWQAKEGGASLDLGTVGVTRLVVLTKTPGLRERIQQRYAEKFAANVKALNSARRASDSERKQRWR